jgi:hypothetical protein
MAPRKNRSVKQPTDPKAMRAARLVLQFPHKFDVALVDWAKRILGRELGGRGRV